MARDIRGSKENSQRTQDTARWAREQIKRQCGKFYKPTRIPEPLLQSPGTARYAHVPLGHPLC